MATGRRIAALVTLGGGAVLSMSVLWLVLTGSTSVRYSADSPDTVPFWQRWVPLLVGVVLVRLAPARIAPDVLRQEVPPRSARLVAAVLVAAAVLFAVLLRVLGGGEPAHTLLKGLLLLGVPLILFLVLRQRETPWVPPEPASARLAPAVPVVAWLVLTYASPLALPAADYALDPLTLVVVLVVGFVINALLEETFYRRWLQSAVETLLGRWAAITVAALLYGVWHAAIQGVGRLDVDLASAVANQGALGVFLGYLWSRYRRMWPVLIVHGALNAVPLLTAALNS